jgi:DDE superfamily endonuclease
MARYTRPLGPDARVLSVDEKTSLPPRPRQHPTQPAQPKHVPTRCEHADKRAGALNRFAAVDTRSGKVYGPCDERKRQRECLAFLDTLEAAIDERIRTMHLVCDQVRTHHGKEVRPWLATHARCVLPCTPGHGSWMNPVEHWCSMLPRKR